MRSTPPAFARLLRPSFVGVASLFLVFATLLNVPAPAAIATSPDGETWWSAAVEASLERAGDRRLEWVGALHAVPEDQRDELAFLLEHMPTGDLATLDAEYILENVALACAAREAVPWGNAIPDAVFLNDILPYANINEPRDPWRAEFKERFLGTVMDCATPAEAAHRLNQQIFRDLGVKYSTKRKRADQSPAESIEIGMASCTGLSIMLTDACRAVGVPARVAGIPNWIDKRGNHTWVEIWDGGRWHFAGAAEAAAEGLNHAWFVGDAALAQRDVPEHAIYAISYRRTGLEFPMAFNPEAERVHAVNVTDRYAKPNARPDDETQLRVTVVNVKGERVAAAVTVRDTEDPTATFTGVTRDESFDTNDVLTFRVARERRHAVAVGYAGVSRAQEVAPGAAEYTAAFIIDPDAPGDALPGDEQIATQLDAFFADPDSPLSSAIDSLVFAEPGRARELAWQAYRRSGHPELKADFDADRVRFERHESPYVARRVGDRPENGWPLVIAMHGGGGAPKEVNDRGWKTMQRYYRDQSDLGGYVYLALRAPNDTWNGFYDDYVYPLITNLVRQFTLFGDVDPNRVHLIGYSHGGYGAFSIGPKIPHRFAAIHASAAAPTDGDSVPRGLRNTPFTFMIGENDTAYGRRARCEAFDAAVRSLRGDRNDIYPVTMEFKEGFGHGGLPDRDKIRELLERIRVSHPRDLSWEMTDTVVRDHFWLSVPDAARGRIIEATCRANTISLKATGVSHLSLLLDERLVDPRLPIAVRIGDKTLVCSPRPSMRELCASIAHRGDPGLSHTMRIDVDLDAMTVTPSQDEGTAARGRTETADWSQWRGPNKDGIAADTAWSSTGRDEPRWKTNVGLGYSNVCLSGGRLITHGFFEDEKEDRIVCLDAASGREHWRFSYPSRIWDEMHAGGTLTTPVAGDGLVYVLSRLGAIRCLDLETGALVWERALLEDLEVSPGTFGLPVTPLLLPEGIVLNVGKTLLLDKKTGATIWQTKDYGYSYSVPVDCVLRGRPSLAVFNGTGFVALDRATGAETDVLPWKSQYNVNCASPIVIGDRVFISTGYGDKGCAMLDLSADELEIVWQSKVMRNKMTGCVLFGEHLYGFDDKMLKCIDLDGNEKWRERGLGTGTMLVSADGRMVVLSEDGEMVVARATPDGFEEYTRRKLFEDGKCWTTPVLSGGLVYCRNSNGELLCLDHRPGSP